MKHGPTQHAPPADGTCRIDRWNVLLQAEKHARIAQNGARGESTQNIAIFRSTDNQMVSKTKTHKRHHFGAKNATFRTFARGVRRGRDSHESSDIITLREIEKINRKPQSANGGRQTIEHSQPRRSMPYRMTNTAKLAKKNGECLGKSGETANFALPHGTKRGNHPNK